MYFLYNSNKFDYYSQRLLNKNSTKSLLTKELLNSTPNKLDLALTIDFNDITKSSNFGIITEVRDEAVFVMKLNFHKLFRYHKIGDISELLIIMLILFSACSIKPSKYYDIES